MGRVFLAHDPAIDRKVALKTIHLPEGLSNEARADALARFQREVRAAGKLVHPNIVTIYDLGQDPGLGAFIAMEFVEGSSLEARCRPGRLLPPRTVASIACQAADALAYAHREGIVHRDIKPANLMLVGEQTVKVADFGLAKPVGASLTTDGTLLGTPNYMSPEQVQGGQVDGRSDLFSLAVVVYELLTGKRPFRGDSISTIVYRIMQEPPVEPDLGRLAEAAQVKEFLARALAKKPEDRFQTGDEFARGLREAFTPPAQPAADVVQTGTGSDGAQASPGRASAPPASTAGREVSKRQAGARASPARRVGTSRGKTGAVAKRARRRRRPVSLLPLLLFVVGAIIAGWAFRDTIFQWVAPYMTWLPVAQQAQVAQGERESEQAIPSEQTPPAEAVTPQSADAEALPGAELSAPPEPRVDEMAPSLEALVTLWSDPAGAEFRVEDRILPADRILVPDEGAELEVHAVLGCREGRKNLTAADAGTEVLIELEPMMREVRVTSKPDKAVIRVDGEKRGQTPTDLSLDGCHEHRIALSRDGYREWTRGIELEEGVANIPDTIAAELQPLPRGTLLVPSPPYPVRMELPDGRRLKAGEKVRLITGTYRVKFSSGKLMLNKTVRVKVPANKSVSPQMEFPPLATLSVRAQPSNAKIVVSRDGAKRDLGAPPIFAEELVAGTYTVKCTFGHNGEAQERSVTLSAGDNPPVVFLAGKP
jgi:serine/threonine-protein kinase